MSGDIQLIARSLYSEQYPTLAWENSSFILQESFLFRSALLASGWIGVDFDGTLCELGSDHENFGVGAPVQEMINRVRRWLSLGLEVKVVTARVADGSSLNRYRHERAVKDFCLEHLGRELEVTCKKDYNMIELWDDRAVGVWSNTGVPRLGSAFWLKEGEERC